ncbi:MAG: hypothetical protein ACQEWU_18840 [Bacillota bacterium]|uniref:Uncharacterized protein n=1 Tax=Virgibacillus salarius TaxID=447199 RepID=A0A941IAP8_9BACI|nr:MULTISPECIES: hypothetical protein [Bacillaceae]NAZ09618.1 hypothetical protein [Agaribacter marinus]MBR7796908.1 hypothetical protein [Virgibacillus salarius]MCC2250672.1 hypothetical protein [Virgibacillus sp. AGTR]MDY7046355.1 hypothetical protein [Virgibacillus sp. M23]QRZ19537.1 hypothetical protein JUJ52_07715 [Virgibacillus sp. AGTR]
MLKAKEIKKAKSSYKKLKTPTKPIVLNSSSSIKRGMFRRGGCCGKIK